MDEKKLKRSEVKIQLNEIITLFHKFPKIKYAKDKLHKQHKPFLTKALENAAADLKKKIDKGDTLQELIDYLRVCIKYMIFDAEAYNRENEYLRKLLREKK